MAQATTTVVNGTGKAVRTGFNSAIQAVQSMFYGSDDPLTEGFSVAGMLWLDSGNNLVKQMNSSNTAWVTKGTVDSDGTIIWGAAAGGSGSSSGAAPAGYGLGTYGRTLTSVDLDTVYACGDYWCISCTDVPETYGTMHVASSSSGDITQDFYAPVTDKKYKRSKANGAAWSDWKQVATTDDISSASVIFPLGQGDYIASGLKMSSISSLVATLESGTVVIDNESQEISSTSVALPVRKPNLIYASSDQSLGYVSGAYPTSYIDNYTVGFWEFNQTTSGAVIPNSAYGVSSSAVANDLTPTGGVSSVDGWADYALKLDGTTGYFVGANTTNFPSGAAEREVNVLFTVNNLSTSTWNPIFCYGALSTSTGFGLYINSSGYFTFIGISNDVVTTFKAEIGKTYLATMQYDGTYGYLYINGNLVYKGTWSISTTLTYSLYVGREANNNVSSYVGYFTLHYLELRTKMRSTVKLGAMANSLLIPCFYDKNSATAPTVPSAYSSTYHEYLFSESSGTSVADSNTSSALAGTATNSTVVTSDIGLSYARKFISSSQGYISLGSFAPASTFSYIGVVNLTAYSTSQILWSNRTTSSTGNSLYINTSGYVTWCSTTTTTVLNSTPIPLNTPVFIAVTINGTTAKVYMNSVNPVTAIITAPYTTSSYATYLGYEPVSTTSYVFTGKYDYCMFVNSELSQAEINYYYTELMETGRRSIIDDMLPSSSVALAFARTNSSKIIEYNDTDYKYGRREKATGGNRKVFLGWKYFSGATTLSWDNPFGTPKYKKELRWAMNASGSNELVCWGYTYNGSTYYGTCATADSNGCNDNFKINMHVQAGGATTINGTWQTSGYIGCYAEVLENEGEE